MKAFPRAIVQAADVVAPQPLLAEMDEMAGIANGGIDTDNLKDDLLGVAKWRVNSFHEITLVQAGYPVGTTQTVGADDVTQQWIDCPALVATPETGDAFLQIEASGKFKQGWTVGQFQEESLLVGVFVDGGLKALAPPCGYTGAAPTGCASFYVNCAVPVAAGAHEIKIRWMYDDPRGPSSDMDVVWFSRRLWIREARR